MVRPYAVRSYVFPEMSGNALYPSASTNIPIVGELVRIKAVQNVTGSLILYESGATNYQIFNASMTSGTASVYNADLARYASMSNGVTGSPQAFVQPVTNSVIILSIGSVTSGTAVKLGPVELLYR